MSPFGWIDWPLFIHYAPFCHEINKHCAPFCYEIKETFMNLQKKSQQSYLKKMRMSEYVAITTRATPTKSLMAICI